MQYDECKTWMQWMKCNGYKVKNAMQCIEWNAMWCMKCN